MKNISLHKFLFTFLPVIFACSLISSSNSFAQTILFTANLSVGSRHPDVLTLQSCLATQNIFHVTPTGYFGLVTEAGVKEFQTKNNIVSSGTALTTGFGRVGPKTRALLNTICGSEVTSVELPIGQNVNTNGGTLAAPSVAPSVDLTAARLGTNAYRLSWSSVGTSSCSSNDFYINDALVNTSRSVDVHVATTTIYSIKCVKENSGIESVEDNVVITP